jgi:hypothetical protein
MKTVRIDHLGQQGHFRFSNVTTVVLCHSYPNFGSGLLRDTPAVQIGLALIDSARPEAATRDNKVPSRSAIGISTLRAYTFDPIVLVQRELDNYYGRPSE